AGLEQHFARDAADGGRAGPYQRATKPRDRSVPRQHDDRPASDLGKLTPPDLTSGRQRRQEAPAASRNDARSPHSSAASSGYRSYAAYAPSISTARLRARRAASASSISAESESFERARRAAA